METACGRAKPFGGRLFLFACRELAMQAAIQQFVGIPGDVLKLIGYCLSRPNILKDLNTGLSAMVSSLGVAAS